LQEKYIIHSENKWIPDGFHFLGPIESEKRRAFLSKVSSYFMAHSFQEVIPPSFDFTSSFVPFLLHTERDKLLKAKDLHGKEISPSIDLTIQVVKGMAAFNGQPLQKVYYTGKVVKDNYKQNADLREFLQLGVEILGSSSPTTFCELLSHINALIGISGLGKKLTLVLGNTSVFSALSSILALDVQEKSYLSKLIYQKNIHDIQLFLLHKKEKDIVDVLIRMLTEFEPEKLSAIFSKLETKYSISLQQILVSTQNILNYSNSNLPNIDLCIDYSLIRDLDYYTGFVFHGYVDKLAYPLVMGGEYNHLFEKFSGVQKDASGFAININLLEEVL
jgi:ATP phosphoribosyltransferase regulatory subunit